MQPKDSAKPIGQEYKCSGTKTHDILKGVQLRDNANEALMVLWK
jgi:hypothetical protein